MSASRDDRSALTAARRLTLDATAARIVNAMAEAGVRSLLLKGATLSDLYEGSRPYSDIDLLVSPDAVDGAEASLRELGFESRHDDPHSRIWRRGGLDVDLHTTIVGVHADPRRLWEVLSAQTEMIRVGDGSIEGLNPAARALHVVLHAAQHGAQEEKPREDLRRALALVPTETWADAARLAAGLDAHAAFWVGLGMEPKGRELQSSLDLTRGRRRTETELRAATAPPTAVGLLRLADTPGLGGKLNLIWREAFPSASFLRTWSPVARRGSAGLAIAYVWRPIWIVARTGPALVAIMRARRAARD